MCEFLEARPGPGWPERAQAGASYVDLGSTKETQDLIINTSFELFYEKGYNATSIPDIMKETSLSKGAFYHHFKNKHEIGTKVIEVIIRKRIKEGF